MKVVLSGSQDWVVYVVMFALSAALHTGGIFLIFMTEPSAAIQGILVDDSTAADSPSVTRVLETWKSRIGGHEAEMTAELDSKINRIAASPQLESPWTKENAATKLQALASAVGTDVRTAEVQRADGGRLRFRLELQSEPDSVLADLALVTRLVGLATQKKGLATERLVVEVFDPAEKQAGRFELTTQESRDLAAGRMTLKELFQAGLQSR
jgi:hypothetical protein